MNRNEALVAVLDYVDNQDWEPEILDLSDTEFKQAMLDAGLIYITKDGDVKKRGRNGIYQKNLEGVPFRGMSDHEIQSFKKIGFSEVINIDGSNFKVEKMFGDNAAIVTDADGKTIGFVSPTRDTRCHWLEIPTDTRPMMMSFTTQIPGGTKLLDGVWNKGPSMRDPKVSDFYHNEVSQRVLASRCVDITNKKVSEECKAQWLEMDFNAMNNWVKNDVSEETEIEGVKVTLKKRAGEKIANIFIDDINVGVASDYVTRFFKHFTHVKFNRSEENVGTKLTEIGEPKMKTIIEWIYATMVNVGGNTGLKKSGKTLKKIKEGTTVKSFSSL